MRFIETIAKLSEKLSEEDIEKTYKEIVNSIDIDSSKITYPGFDDLYSLAALGEKLDRNVKLNSEDESLLTEFAEELGEYLQTPTNRLMDGPGYYDNARIISNRIEIITERYKKVVEEKILPEFPDDKKFPARRFYLLTLSKNCLSKITIDLLDNQRVIELCQEHAVDKPKSLAETFEKNEAHSSHGNILKSLTANDKKSTSENGQPGLQKDGKKETDVTQQKMETPTPKKNSPVDKESKPPASKTNQSSHPKPKDETSMSESEKRALAWEFEQKKLQPPPKTTTFLKPKNEQDENRPLIPPQNNRNDAENNDGCTCSLM